MRFFFCLVLFFHLLNVIYYATHSDPHWHVVLSEKHLIRFVLEGFQSSSAWNVSDSRRHYKRLWNIQLCCLLICAKNKNKDCTVRMPQMLLLNTGPSQAHKDRWKVQHAMDRSHKCAYLLCSSALLCLFTLRGSPHVSDQYQLRATQDQRKQKGTFFKTFF